MFPVVAICLIMRSYSIFRVNVVCVCVCECMKVCTYIHAHIHYEFITSILDTKVYILRLHVREVPHMSICIYFVYNVLNMLCSGTLFTNTTALQG